MAVWTLRVFSNVVGYLRLVVQEYEEDVKDAKDKESRASMRTE